MLRFARRAAATKTARDGTDDPGHGATRSHGPPGTDRPQAGGRRPAFGYALAGAVLFACSLAVWFAWVAPANGVLATWRPGPIPADFQAVRDRWETGHMAVAGLKLLGFVAIALAVLPRGAEG